MAIQAKTVIMGVVALLLATILFPVAMRTLVTNTENSASTPYSLWSASVQTIYSLVVPLLAIIGVVLYFAKSGGK